MLASVDQAAMREEHRLWSVWEEAGEDEGGKIATSGVQEQSRMR